MNATGIFATTATAVAVAFKPTTPNTPTTTADAADATDATANNVTAEEEVVREDEDNKEHQEREKTTIATAGENGTKHDSAGGFFLF